MYIDQEGTITDRDHIHLYYTWYSSAGEFTASQEKLLYPFYTERSQYMGITSVDMIVDFAEYLPSTTRWEQVEFLWEVFNAQDQ